jgi:hypothetical protein
VSPRTRGGRHHDSFGIKIGNNPERPEVPLVPDISRFIRVR